MKLSLLTDSGRRAITETTEHYAFVEGACPACGAEPLRVRGHGRRISTDDRAYEANGVALCCDTFVGTIRADVSTIFGLHEDEAMLYGRPRVY